MLHLDRHPHLLLLCDSRLIIQLFSIYVFKDTDKYSSGFTHLALVTYWLKSIGKVTLFLQALGLSSEKLWIIRVSLLYQLGGSEKRMILNTSTEGIYCREVVFPGVGRLNEQKEWRGNMAITEGRGFCPRSWVNKGDKWGCWNTEAQRKSCEEPQGTRALTLDVGALPTDAEVSEKAQ